MQKYGSLMSELLRSLVRPAVFRLAESRAKRAVTPKLSYLRQYYKKSNDQRQKIDQAQLQAMLQYAVEHVPYYAKVIDKNLIEKIGRDPRFYQDLPVLTKDIVNEAGEQLLSKQFAPTDLKKMKTGGSTGASAYFYYDQEAADWSSATTWYCRAHYESLIHNRQLHFACDFGDAEQNPYRSLRSLGEYLATNRVNIFSMDFSEKQIEYYVQQLVEKRPNLVHGHPSTMYAIASHAAKAESGNWAGLFNYFESSGETIYEHQKQLIADVFKCTVLNRYGLAEAGVVAYQTKKRTSSLQVMTHLIYLDPVDSPGERELIFSTLRNSAMPLIRYNSGDVVVVGEQHEQSDGLYFDSIQGRIHDFVQIGERRVPTHAVMDVIDHRIGGVHEFQLIRKKSDGSLTLRIVPMTDSFDSKLAGEKWEKHFGIPVQLEIVTENGLLRGGYRNKFRHLIEVD
jgi:phenylacetate-CoA ligase